MIESSPIWLFSRFLGTENGAAMTMKCAYCNKPAWTKDVDPPMCLNHLDLALLVSRVTRSGKPVTEVAVLRVMENLPVEKRRQLSIRARDIAKLLEGMLEAER
jgi:hypothetical protein